MDTTASVYMFECVYVIVFINNLRPGVVIPACNPNYSEG
jgi:hypothetical protein